MWKRALALLSAITLGLAVVNAQEAVKTPKFEPLTWNASQIDNEDGTYTAEFHGKHINYMVSNGVWSEIDLTLNKDGDTWVMNKAPYAVELPEYANGEMEFTATNKYDVRSKKFVKASPISKTRTFKDAKNVKGVLTDEGLLYQDAIDDFSLLLQPHEEEMRYLLKFDHLPQVCETEEFLEVRFEHDLKGLIPKKKDNTEITSTDKTIDGYYIKSEKYRGIGTPEARIWDSDAKGQVVDIVAKYNPNKLDGKKVIPCSFFDDAVYPVYSDDTDTFHPDADEEERTCDGWLREDGAVWNTIHDALASTTYNTDTRDIGRAGVSLEGATYRIMRAAMSFDLSSISGETATSVDLDLEGTGWHDHENDIYSFITLVNATPASDTALIGADYDQITGKLDACIDTDWTTPMDIDQWATGSYNTFTLNATGEGKVQDAIDDDGIFWIAVREGHDCKDYAPDVSDTERNGVDWDSADVAGTSSDPKLSVTYTGEAGAGATPTDAMIFLTIF